MSQTTAIVRARDFYAWQSSELPRLGTWKPRRRLAHRRPVVVSMCFYELVLRAWKPTGLPN